MSKYWQGKRVLVTGGGGFIGSHLCEELAGAGARVTAGDLKPGHLSESRLKKEIAFSKIDFFNTKECVAKIKGYDTVMHLAAKVGGIQYNIKYAYDLFASNNLITVNVTKAVAANAIPRITLVSSACVYPSNAKIPTPESEGFLGNPETSNEGYGWAKRNMEIAGKMLMRQYGTEVAIVRPSNAFGPRDKFDPESSHVIAALINKVFQAKNGKISVWGSGKQTRSFLYVKDAVRGMMLAMEKYPVAYAVNLGSDEEVTVEKLTDMIIDLSGAGVTAVFDKSKPEGYSRRKSDTSLSHEKLGFVNEWELKDGLKETINYYRESVLRKG